MTCCALWAWLSRKTRGEPDNAPLPGGYFGSLAIVSWGIATSKPAPEDDCGEKAMQFSDQREPAIRRQKMAREIAADSRA
jgi:hypothetical protein